AIKRLLALIALLILVLFTLHRQQPEVDRFEKKYPGYSLTKVLAHIQRISVEPHYTGSQAHAETRKYIIQQLELLGLSPEVQSGYVLNEGLLVKPHNILARIKGKNPDAKALALMAHYDSRHHSSYGASDDAVGVAIILEAARRLLQQSTPENDIIILFTDAEELGLNGAQLFVERHPWVDDIGLVLNFEARGSAGPSYMFMEVTQGNAEMIKHFAKANIPNAATNSLAYSIYKMLPNDTDLTVFRTKAAINGFNFAFIDNHFHYHTELDSYKNLDRQSISHHAQYALGLLDYFHDKPLQNFNSDHDYVYIALPLLGVIFYPFEWIPIIAWVVLAVFLALTFWALTQSRLKIELMVKSFAPSLLSLAISTGLCFALWRLIAWWHPEYAEILQGFPYNGHSYILAFVFLALAIFAFIFRRFKDLDLGHVLFSVLLLWWLIAFFAADALPGAAFLMLPVALGCLIYAYVLIFKGDRLRVFLILAIPVVFVLLPFVEAFVIALGFKIVWVAPLMIVLMLWLLLPVIHTIKMYRLIGVISLLIGAYFFLKAEWNAEFNKENPKPNSLVYLSEAKHQKAYWLTYDNILDAWTKEKLGESPILAKEITQEVFQSKYTTGFSYGKEAQYHRFNTVELLTKSDTLIDNQRELEVAMVPAKNSNKIEVFAENPDAIEAIYLQGMRIESDENSSKIAKSSKNNILRYVPVDKDTLWLKFILPKDHQQSLSIYDISYHLLSEKSLNLSPRPEIYIAKGFVTNDAIIQQHEFRIKAYEEVTILNDSIE
ncbi:MAG: M20/M25/M40 family metallo-hydrolase, partial [Flavobacteriaceae bacterium]|nr:M20/M25/M40 family metallo-hydrolase [Flavobacteriaceae bacterium]